MHSHLIRQKERLDHFFSALDPSAFDQALTFCAECQGKIILTGVGKSGLIAESIAQMLTSLGTKAVFLSPLNACHGDLGMIETHDRVILLSKSGNTKELLDLAWVLQQEKMAMMAWVCAEGGKLKQYCAKTIVLPLLSELCPFDLSPTTSSVVQLIFGNALAVALMEKKEFSRENYRKNHPSGTIGKKLLTRVEDVMLKGDCIPLCDEEDAIGEILVELSDKRCGCLVVKNRRGEMSGIFTDGDLRRALKNLPQDVFTTPVKTVMTADFLSIQPGSLAVDALKLMQRDAQKKISVLPVVENQRPIGLIRLHDILALGID